MSIKTTLKSSGHRIDARATADRKGRAVTVERVTPTRTRGGEDALDGPDAPRWAEAVACLAAAASQYRCR